MKNVMKRAWEIYRTLTGDKLAKLSMALKQAWSEIKGGIKVALKGSEKQVEWALKIKAQMIKEANAFIAEFSTEAEAGCPIERRINRCKKLLAEIESKEDAQFFIKNRTEPVYGYDNEWYGM